MTANEQTRWHEIKGIFEDACEADPDKRLALVAQRCNGDETLRNEVEQLLALRHESDLALDRRPSPSLEQQEFAAKAAREAADSPQQTQPRYRAGDLIGGRYRIVSFLARGGMGEVYEALDGDVENEKRAVALKFVRRLPAGRELLESRFLREVKMARKIEHPNVCRIFDLSKHEGERFCAMELLRGETLAAKLNREIRITPSDALRIARQICDGLSAAHHADVLHRDLKPGNIFLVGDRAVIIDFGLATAALRDTTSTDATCTEPSLTEPSLTATGAVIGTLAYMAPEQFEERGGGIQADIYSLGVIFFEMLTGEKPHDAKSPFLLAAQKARESHRAGSGSAGCGVPGMPPVWQEVITRSLKARPEDRYKSAEELKLALERGRPSTRFVLTQPRVFCPALAAMLAMVAWIGWSWARKDHVPAPQAQKFYEQAYEAMTTAAAPMRAMKLLEQAVAADPQFVNAQSLLAVALADADQLDQAKDALLRAISTKEKRWMLGHGESLGLAAANAAVVRDYNAAAQSYGDLAQVPGNRDFALLSRARMLEQAGKRDDAIRTFGESSNPAARIRMAGLLCRKREYEKAAAEFAMAEQVYAKSGNQEGLCDLWLGRALTLRTQTREQDRADLERVIAVSAKTGNQYHNLAARLRMVVVYERERDYQRAIDIATEVAAEAQRDGMLVMEARATAEIGYAYVYLKKLEEAVPILRRSVEMAERAKSYGLLASNRLKLGEALAALNRPEEAVPLLEPAMQWYRQAGVDTIVPLMLIKWGTALQGTSRSEDAEKAFVEAYDLSVKNGEEMYEAMALQRLGGFYDYRNLRKAAEWSEKSLILARKTVLTGAYFQAANVWASLGDWKRANELIAEGEKEAREKYPEGQDKRLHFEAAEDSRAVIDFGQGRCAQAAARLRPLTLGAQGRIDRMRTFQACAGSSSAAVMRADLASFDVKLAEAEARKPRDVISISRVPFAAGVMALRLKDWSAARSYALRGIAAARERGYRRYEFENTLLLLAAQGQTAELKAEVLKLAREMGFVDEKFNGRQDLVYLWRLGARR